MDDIVYTLHSLIKASIFQQVSLIQLQSAGKSFAQAEKRCSLLLVAGGADSASDVVPLDDNKAKSRFV